jgi:uncharacterized membrane-anchored protein YitT (DUF2179 family)
MPSSEFNLRTFAASAWVFLLISLGAFLAAFSIQTFLIPNRLIDGGIVGLAMIFGNLFGLSLIPYFYVFLTLPFVFFAYRAIGKSFVIQMGIASVLFFGFMVMLHQFVESGSTVFQEFKGETLEVVVIGGSLLGIGLGLIIRVGGCVDGTEVLGIVINKRTGFTVGQTVLACNIFVFGALGLVFKDWHPPFLSLIMYIVVAKVMDAVVVGLDETKSVLIISSKYREISKAILHELGLGLTVMYGRGGFSGSEKEILYVITERLQLATLKELVLREDPSAFIAVENLHEVANGNPGKNKMNPVAQVKALLTSVFLKKG